MANQTPATNAACDGYGMQARQKLFAYKASSVIAYPCLGQQCKPCTECTNPVCNQCRFHVMYDEASDEIWQVEEEYADGVQDQWPWRNGVLEAQRSLQIWMGRVVKVCKDCQPAETEGEEATYCTCSMYKHFVAERWLCLPCYLKEEVEAAEVEEARTRVVRFDRGATKHEDAYVKETLCPCGKAAGQDALPCCRFCDKAVREGFEKYYEHSITKCLIPKIEGEGMPGMG